MPVGERIKTTKFQNPAHRAVVSILVTAAYLEQRSQEICERHGITVDQFNVLRILRGAHPGGHPRYEIANRLVSRAPDVTRLLERLERQGLVERSRCTEDQRRTISRITSKGLALLDALNPELEALREEVTSRLSAADCNELARLCDEIVP
jgi:DNA-binding MarR family transcriptional regulator